MRPPCGGGFSGCRRRGVPPPSRHTLAHKLRYCNLTHTLPVPGARVESLPWSSGFVRPGVQKNRPENAERAPRRASLATRSGRWRPVRRPSRRPSGSRSGPLRFLGRSPEEGFSPKFARLPSAAYIRGGGRGEGAGSPFTPLRNGGAKAAAGHPPGRARQPLHPERATDQAPDARPAGPRPRQRLRRRRAARARPMPRASVPPHAPP
jgi:hypothetical protein